MSLRLIPVRTNTSKKLINSPKRGGGVVAKSQKRKSPKKKSSQSGQRQAARRTELVFQYDELEQLFQVMRKHQMAEIEWEKNNERLVVRSDQAFSGTVVAGVAPSVAAPVATPSATVSASDSLAADSAASAQASQGNYKTITSPFVGTFYRSPSPEADPYAKEGQRIKPGDVLCIVEAMKLMNEIEADTGGKIVSILVENGQPVEFGEPLFTVDPS